MTRISSIADWVLRTPLLWGGLACLAFYALIGSGQLDNPYLERYFNSHIVEQITTALFFIGAAALVLRLAMVLGQFGVAGRELIDPIPAGGQPLDEAGLLLASLTEQPEYLRNTYLVRRLSDALDWVRRRDAVDGIDEELLRLEQKDWDRMASGYSLVRVVAWAMPMLGFLGTVIGITMALANLDIQALIDGEATVVAALSVAFDTTALALSLTVVMMLAKFGVEHVEERLLTEVAARCRAELVGRFQQAGTAADPGVASVHRMCDQVVRAAETLAARQADLWKSTIDETNTHWRTTLAESSEQFGDALQAGLRDGLKDHAEGLTGGVEQQLRRLNEAVAGQVESLGETVSGASERLAGALSEQSGAVSSACEAQVEQLAMSAANLAGQVSALTESHVDRLTAQGDAHAARLDTGASDLLSNLRGGLERMAELLVEALQKHGETLTDAEQELASENRRHLSEVEAALGEAMVLAADRQEKLIRRSEDLLGEMQNALVGAADATVSQQEQLVKQGEVLLKVVDSTGQIQRLEDSLSQNLATLGRTHNLEETLLSLSAAIQLLSARVGATPAAAAPSNPTSHAA